MRAINIEWDADTVEEIKELPTQIEIPNGLTEVEEISDYITEITGFCSYGFELISNYNEVIPTNNKENN